MTPVAARSIYACADRSMCFNTAIIANVLFGSEIKCILIKTRLKTYVNLVYYLIAQVCGQRVA